MHDLAVIGGGPGGYVAAICAAQKGLKVLLVEKDSLGGTCLNRGCIPTKCFVYDTKLYEAVKTSPVLKGQEGIAVDIQKMVERKRRVVTSLVGGLGAVIKSNGIEVAKGHGELVAPGKLRVTNGAGSAKDYEAKHVILANGSKPAVLPFITVDGGKVQTTDQALDAETIPKRIVVLGGGVIGMEMATIYLNLGCEVHILELLPDVLMTEDEEVRKTMRTLLKRRGAVLHLNAMAKAVDAGGEGVTIAFEDEKKGAQTLQTERLLVATGRTPVLDGIDAAALGLAMDGPFVKVNSRLETNLPGVYAIGDLVGGMMLAHKASAEAEAAVANILGGNREVNPQLVPRCIWGLAEVGAIGMTEEEATRSGRSVRVGKFPYAFSGAAQAMGDMTGFAKIIADTENGEIIGVHVMGEHATDLIGESATVMTMESAVEDLAEAVKPHPTLSECIMEAAMDWSGHAVHAPKKR